jgi:excinuclease ABC subunit C
VEALTTPETYANAVRDAQLFLEGRSAELERALTARMMAAAELEQFEAAARLRDQLSTVHQLQEKQRIATAEQDDDADVFGYHFEAGSLAVNLFHVRAGKIVDRREFFWEDLPELLEASALESEGLHSPEEDEDAHINSERQGSGHETSHRAGRPAARREAFAG